MSAATMGSIARSLTKRTKRSNTENAEDAPFARSGSVRYPAGTIDRGLISLPTELISTTNVNALNYPDIGSLRSASSNSSLTSGHESDFTHMSRSFIDSPATSAETSSIESSPMADKDTAPSFFHVKRSATTAGNGPSTADSAMAPVIPQRALSRSKRNHQELARKRSVTRLSPPPNALAGPIVRSSADIFSGAVQAEHPFGKELAQVNEVAEEFGLVSASLAQEERDLVNRGLMKFGVEDYLNEIVGLYGGVYENKLGPMANPWV